MVSHVLRAAGIACIMAWASHAAVITLEGGLALLEDDGPHVGGPLPDSPPADLPPPPRDLPWPDPGPPEPAEGPLTCPQCPDDSLLCHNGAVCETNPELIDSCRNNCEKCKAEFFFPRDTEKRTVNCNMGSCDAGCSPYIPFPCADGITLECAADQDCKPGYTCCKICCGTACRKLEGPGPDSVHPGKCPAEPTDAEDAVSCTLDTDCRTYQKCCGPQDDRTCQEALDPHPQ